VAASISGYDAFNFSTISGDISFTGLGSGTDFTKIIDALMKVESIQKTRMELWRKDWEAKIASITSLKQRLTAIEEAARSMDTTGEFLVRQATSSDSDVVTATASSEASNGAYNVTVATNSQHILGTSGVAASSTAITRHTSGSQNLIISVGGTQHTIAIAAGRTITQVAQDITNYFSSTTAPVHSDEVVASVENDGTSNNPYRLVLQSNIGGASGEIEVLQNPLTLSFSSTDAALYQDWTSGSGPDITVGGQFNGSSDDLPAGQSYFSYRIYNTEATARTVGTDTITLGYQVNTASGVVSGTVTVPSSYKDGDSIEIHNGILLQLEEGKTVGASDDFYLTAYCNDFDTPETGSNWTGTASVSAAGNYMGTVNKTYSFTVVSDDGTLAASDPSDALTLRWTDSTGDTGTVEVAYSGTNYEIEQGVYLNLGAGTFVNGDTFTLDVSAPERQAAQAEGLAQVCKVVHDGFPDSLSTPVTSTAGGDKTFTYVYAGEEINVTVAGGTTLSQLVSLINNDSNNPGVHASVTNDGLGLPNSYKLVLTGEHSGAEYQITRVSHDFAGGTFESAAGDVGGGFSLNQKATNSLIRVDGFPSSPMFLQREDNTVSDVITGVTLDLHDAGNAKITVSTDVNAVGAKIEKFINAVNYAQDFIRQETKFDQNHPENNGVLIGNYGYQIIKSRIDTILNSSITGLTDGVDPYTHLSQIGIKTDPDNNGRWTIDNTALRNALNANADAVANLFIDNSDKNTEGVAKRMYDEMYVQTNTGGMLPTLKDNYEEIISNIDKRIEREDRRLKLVRDRYKERFARLEATLAKLNTQSESLKSQIAKLPKIGKASG